MNFDEILDFLFHRIIGICISVAAAVVMMLALTGCIGLDFCGCFWTGCGCNDCGKACVDCSENIDDVCWGCFGGSSNPDESCMLADCLWGPNGCTAECGSCYVECGGVNFSIFRSVCLDDGCGKGCVNSEQGYKQYDCMNCYAWCNALEDPESPIYQKIFLYTFNLVDYEGNSRTFEYYQNTKYLPKPDHSPSGMEFVGYFSEKNGNGTRITEADGTLIAAPSSGASVYAYYKDYFEGEAFTLKIYAYNSELGDYTLNETTVIYAGDGLQLFIPDTLTPPEGHYIARWKLTSTQSGGNYWYVTEGDTVISNYATFKPGEYGFYYGYEYNSEQKVLSLYPEYEPTRYSLQIAYGEELGVSSNLDRYEGVTYGTLLSSLGARSISGYKFLGFSYDEIGYNMLPEDYAITQDEYVYAIYRREVTVWFEETVGAPYFEVYYEGQSVELPAPKHVAAGEEYVGWSLHNDFSNIFTELVVGVEHSDIRLVPHFGEALYDITYTEEDGTVLGHDSYSYGAVKTLQKNDKPYHDFVGWRDMATNHQYTDELPSTMYGDLILVAVYTPKTYLVSLDENGGSISTYSVNVQFGSDFTLPVPTKASSEFEGWAYYNGIRYVLITDKDGKSLEKFTQYNGFAYSGDSLNIDVVAQWKTKSYEISFYMPDGTQIGSTTTVSHGAYMPSAPADPLMTGYEFVGWSYGKNSYSEVDFAAKVSDNLTIYAYFTPKVYTVRFELAGVGAEFTSPESDPAFKERTYTYGAGGYMSGLDVNRSGYTFRGWYTEAYGGGTRCVAPDGTVLVNLNSVCAASGGTVTLYAVWEITQ